ncbi:MAG: aspartyl protease family protein [Bacteroidota bacterium]
MRVEIPLILVSLQEDGFHFLIKGSINDVELLLVLDTGASRCCFDIRFLEKLQSKNKIRINDSMTSGIGTNSLNSVITKLEEFNIGILSIPKYQAVGIDMSHIHHAYSLAGIPQVDGILGSDVLLKYKAVINYQKRVLILNKRASKNIVI